jgi:hypothetical protein
VPPIASKDSFDPVTQNTPAPEETASRISPPQPQPLKPADPVSKERNYDSVPTPSPLTSPTAPASGEPTSRANRNDAAMIPEETSALVPNQPQARTPSVSAKIRIVGMRKLTPIAPSSGEPDYDVAIPKLNAQLGTKLDRQKVAVSEAIPQQLVLILTAVKVANKQKLWLRAEPNQSNEVNQLVSRLQEALNKDNKIELPAGEYELLVQIGE